MPHEDDIATILRADTPLAAILTGGIHTSGDVGPLGITRTSVRDAFDDDGYLLPCLLVKQRARVPTGDVVDYEAGVVSTAQVVEVWLYCDSADGYAPIDAASARIFALLQGKLLTGSFEVTLTNLIDRQRDPGALSGASMAKMDFAIYSLMSA